MLIPRPIGRQRVALDQNWVERSSRVAFPTPSTSPFAKPIPWWRQLRFKALMAMVGLSVLVTGALFITNYILGKAEVLEQFQQRADTCRTQRPG